MGASSAPHHIFAGVSSIVSTSPASEVKTPALVIAVYFFVTTRLSGTPFSSTKYPQLRSQALEIVKSSAGEDAEWVEVGEADVDHCMREVKNQRWTEMDWFENVPAGDGMGEEEGDEGVVEDSLDEKVEEGRLLPVKGSDVGRDDSSGQDYLQAGLGTMV